MAQEEPARDKAGGVASRTADDPPQVIGQWQAIPENEAGFRCLDSESVPQVTICRGKLGCARATHRSVERSEALLRFLKPQNRKSAPGEVGAWRLTFPDSHDMVTAVTTLTDPLKPPFADER